MTDTQEKCSSTEKKNFFEGLSGVSLSLAKGEPDLKKRSARGGGGIAR